MEVNFASNIILLTMRVEGGGQGYRSAVPQAPGKLHELFESTMPELQGRLWIGGFTGPLWKARGLGLHGFVSVIACALTPQGLSFKD